MASSRPKTPQPPFRVAVDTGGTFTDCVWVERGKLRMVKVFSTPADPSQAIAEALAQANAPGAVILLHGTTVGTNTLLQRKGARVAFVTTAGFEDTIEIGRQNRPVLYDLTFERVPPLVERNMRFGVPERVAPNGEILQKPSREDLKVLARDVHTSGAESIAISTLFSFANPENERAIGRVLDELGLPLSLSHRILPEFREYERASTVVVNAYLQPVMQSYLQQLDVRIRQSGSKAKASRVFVMQSSGGITSLEAASRQPVRTVLSGPAGGSGRRGGDGPTERLRAHRYLRYGRHVDRRRPGRWRTESDQRSRHCRTAGARAYARHSYGRSRRRFAGALRCGRRIARGAGVRGGRSRPHLLRTRTSANRDRRQSIARTIAARQVSGRSFALDLERTRTPSPQSG